MSQLKANICSQNTKELCASTSYPKDSSFQVWPARKINTWAKNFSVHPDPILWTLPANLVWQEMKGMQARHQLLPLGKNFALSELAQEKSTAVLRKCNFLDSSYLACYIATHDTLKRGKGKDYIPCVFFFLIATAGLTLTEINQKGSLVQWFRCQTRCEENKWPSPPLSTEAGEMTSGWITLSQPNPPHRVVLHHRRRKDQMC